MTMKHCTKSSKRSEQQLFYTLHPYGSTTIQKNNWILPFWVYEHLQMTINYWTKYQVPPIGQLGKEVSTSYFTPSTPLESTIIRIWIPLSQQYTLLQMKMTLYKDFKSPLRNLYGKVHTKLFFYTATPLGSTLTRVNN
jgi:hypothetical protein